MHIIYQNTIGPFSPNECHKETIQWREKTVAKIVFDTMNKVKIEAGDAMYAFLTPLLNARHASKFDAYRRVILEEGIINAVMHGNNGDSTKRTSIIITVARKSTHVILHCRFEDEGDNILFLDDIPDATVSDRLTHPHGRGTLLMRSFSDELYTEWTPKGKAVVVVRKEVL